MSVSGQHTHGNNCHSVSLCLFDISCAAWYSRDVCKYIFEWLLFVDTVVLQKLVKELQKSRQVENGRYKWLCASLSWKEFVDAGAEEIQRVST